VPDKPTEEPKLIIDEDWKTQVQREKEELKQKLADSQEEAAQADDSANSSQGDESATPSASPSPETPAPSSAAASETSQDESAQALGTPPPASLTLLVTTLATQAMGAMGLMPDEQGKQLPIHLDFARHFIDMLAVLEEKTKGNLSDEEKTYLADALHQLRIAFVAISKNPPGAK
jgi:hypothetical protein